MNERKPTSGILRDVLPDIPYEAFEEVSRVQSGELMHAMGYLLEDLLAGYGMMWISPHREAAERLLAEWRDWRP